MTSPPSTGNGDWPALAPFPRRWLYYVVLKFVVLGTAGALVLKVCGFW